MTAKEIADKLAQIPTVSLPTASFVDRLEGGQVRVDYGEGPVAAYSAGFATPLPGAAVRTIRVNDTTLMLGPVATSPTFGRITATGTPRVTVALTDGTTHELFYLVSAYPEPSVDDDVKIDWSDGGIILGKVTGVPASDYFPPPAGGSGGSNSNPQQSPEFVATDSGNFWTGGGTWNKDEVWCSPSNTGAWFYQGIADTIPDTATITSVQVYLNESYNQYPTNLAGIGLHSATGKNGNPGIRSAVDISAGSGWKDLPLAFGDELKTGAALGVGTPTRSGFHRYTSRSQDGNSGRLRIGWIA